MSLDYTKKNNANHSIIKTEEIIEAELPQTQCTLCGYNGCKPYAKAIANDNERLDLCLPGGVNVLQKLGLKLNKKVSHLEKDLIKRQKKPSYAVINEENCIGCTKCIQACPVDAIIGRNKKMHRVIEADCTGCELCIEPCPTDCITMVVQENHHLTENQRTINASKAKHRYEARNHRLKLKKIAAKKKYASIKEPTKQYALIAVTNDNKQADLENKNEILATIRQKHIADAIAKKRRQRQIMGIDKNK